MYNSDSVTSEYEEEEEEIKEQDQQQAIEDPEKTVKVQERIKKLTTLRDNLIEFFRLCRIAENNKNRDIFFVNKRFNQLLDDKLLISSDYKKAGQNIEETKEYFTTIIQNQARGSEDIVNISTDEDFKYVAVCTSRSITVFKTIPEQQMSVENNFVQRMYDLDKPVAADGTEYLLRGVVGSILIDKAHLVVFTSSTISLFNALGTDRKVLFKVTIDPKLKFDSSKILSVLYQRYNKLNLILLATDTGMYFLIFNTTTAFTNDVLFCKTKLIDKYETKVKSDRYMQFFHKEENTWFYTEVERITEKGGNHKSKITKFTISLKKSSGTSTVDYDFIKNLLQVRNQHNDIFEYTENSSNSTDLKDDYYKAVKPELPNTMPTSQVQVVKSPNKQTISYIDLVAMRISDLNHIVYGEDSKFRSNIDGRYIMSWKQEWETPLDEEEEYVEKQFEHEEKLKQYFGTSLGGMISGVIYQFYDWRNKILRKKHELDQQKKKEKREENRKLDIGSPSDAEVELQPQRPSQSQVAPASLNRSQFGASKINAVEAQQVDSYNDSLRTKKNYKITIYQRAKNSDDYCKLFDVIIRDVERPEFSTLIKSIIFDTNSTMLIGRAPNFNWRFYYFPMNLGFKKKKRTLASNVPMDSLDRFRVEHLGESQITAYTDGYKLWVTVPLEGSEIGNQHTLLELKKRRHRTKPKEGYNTDKSPTKSFSKMASPNKGGSNVLRVFSEFMPQEKTSSNNEGIQDQIIGIVKVEWTRHSSVNHPLFWVVLGAKRTSKRNKEGDEIKAGEHLTFEKVTRVLLCKIDPGKYQTRSVSNEDFVCGQISFQQLIEKTEGLKAVDSYFKSVQFPPSGNYIALEVSTKEEKKQHKGEEAKNVIYIQSVESILLEENMEMSKSSNYSISGKANKEILQSRISALAQKNTHADQALVDRTKELMQNARMIAVKEATKDVDYYDVTNNLFVFGKNGDVGNSTNKAKCWRFWSFLFNDTLKETPDDQQKSDLAALVNDDSNDFLAFEGENESVILFSKNYMSVVPRYIKDVQTIDKAISWEHPIKKIHSMKNLDSNDFIISFHNVVHSPNKKIIAFIFKKKCSKNPSLDAKGICVYNIEKLSKSSNNYFFIQSHRTFISINFSYDSKALIAVLENHECRYYNLDEVEEMENYHINDAVQIDEKQYDKEEMIERVHIRRADIFAYYKKSKNSKKKTIEQQQIEKAIKKTSFMSQRYNVIQLEKPTNDTKNIFKVKMVESSLKKPYFLIFYLEGQLNADGEESEDSEDENGNERSKKNDLNLVVHTIKDLLSMEELFMRSFVDSLSEYYDEANSDTINNVIVPQIVNLFDNYEKPQIRKDPLYTTILYFLDQEELFTSYLKQDERLTINEFCESHHLWLLVLKFPQCQNSIRAFLDELKEYNNKHNALPYMDRANLKVYIEKWALKNQATQNALSVHLFRSLLFTRLKEIKTIKGELKNKTVATVKFDHGEIASLEQSLQHLFKKHGKEIRTYKAYQTLSELDLRVGSRFSRKLFERIYRLPRREFDRFYRTLLEYKWSTIKFYVRGWNFIILVTACTYMYYITSKKSELAPFLVGSIAANLFFTFVIFMTKEAKNLGNVWKLFFLVMCIVTINHNEKHMLNSTDEESDWKWIKLWTMTEFAFRGIYTLRSFEQTRYTVLMFFQVFYNLLPFFIVLSYAVLSFAVIWMYTPAFNNHQNPGEIEEFSLNTSTRMFMNVIFGAFDTSTNTGFQFITTTVANTILLLTFTNFMIAVIEGIYGDVQEQKSRYDIEDRIKFIRELDTFWFPFLKTYEFITNSGSCTKKKIKKVNPIGAEQTNSVKSHGSIGHFVFLVEDENTDSKQQNLNEKIKELKELDRQHDKNIKMSKYKIERLVNIFLHELDANVNNCLKSISGQQDTALNK